MYPERTFRLDQKLKTLSHLVLLYIALVTS